MSQHTYHVLIFLRGRQTAARKLQADFSGRFPLELREAMVTSVPLDNNSFRLRQNYVLGRNYAVPACCGSQIGHFLQFQAKYAQSMPEDVSVIKMLARSHFLRRDGI